MGSVSRGEPLVSVSGPGSPTLSRGDPEPRPVIGGTTGKPNGPSVKTGFTV